jgi:hypothetical protein
MITNDDNDANEYLCTWLRVRITNKLISINKH